MGLLRISKQLLVACFFCISLRYNITAIQALPDVEWRWNGLRRRRGLPLASLSVGRLPRRVDRRTPPLTLLLDCAIREGLLLGSASGILLLRGQPLGSRVAAGAVRGMGLTAGVVAIRQGLDRWTTMDARTHINPLSASLAGYYIASTTSMFRYRWLGLLLGGLYGASPDGFEARLPGPRKRATALGAAAGSSSESAHIGCCTTFTSRDWNPPPLPTGRVPMKSNPPWVTTASV